MKDIHPPLLNYLKHYAARLKDSLALRILEAGAIADEKEAKALLRFLNVMLDQAVKDQKDGVKVLGEAAHASDAEKAYLAMEDFIAQAGFEDALDEDEDR
jgi:hypothetical protein